MVRVKFWPMRSPWESACSAGYSSPSVSRGTDVPDLPRSVGPAHRSLTVLFSSCIGFILSVTPARAENWPGWRGPTGDGVSREANVPIQWNGNSNEHVAWKVPTPGSGHSSPIVWNDRIFLVG